VHGELDVCVRVMEWKRIFFGKNWRNEAIHVLVSAAFPRGVGMGQEELCIELPGDVR
jgi:hypothetical protein